MRGIPKIIAEIVQLLPAWLVVPFAVACLALAAPVWLHSVRVKQIGGAVRRMVRANNDTRSALHNRVFLLAGGKPGLLLIAVEQAQRYNQRALFKDAMAALQATGQKKKELAIIRAKISPERQHIGHPLEIAVGVQGLVDQGMIDAAQTRLAEALGRYPSDPDLLDLQRRLNNARS